MRSASRRAKSSTASGTRRSCRITSASCSARKALSVSSSGSPGPAPTSVTSPAAGAAAALEASSCCAMRRAPLSSPSMNRRAAGPSTRLSKKRRRASGPRKRRRLTARSSASHEASLPVRLEINASRRSRSRRAKYRRGAAGRDGDEHRIAIDDGRYDEARCLAIVDHVHGDRARVAQVRDPAIHGTARGRRHDHEPARHSDRRERIRGLRVSVRPAAARRSISGATCGATSVIERTGALEQVHLAQRHLAAADDEHLLLL